MSKIVQKHSLIFLDFWKVIFVRGFLQWNYTLKLVSTIFCQIFISHQLADLQKLRKMLFISPKKLFSFSIYSNFCISIFPSFPPCQPLFRDWSKINLKVYDVIKCLNKNLYHVSIIPVRFHAVMKFISDRPLVSI